MMFMFRIVPVYNPATGLSGVSVHYPDVNEGNGLHSTGATILYDRQGNVRKTSLFFP